MRSTSTAFAIASVAFSPSTALRAPERRLDDRPAHAPEAGTEARTLIAANVPTNERTQALGFAQSFAPLCQQPRRG